MISANKKNNIIRAYLKLENTYFFCVSGKGKVQHCKQIHFLFLLFFFFILKVSVHYPMNKF